MSAKPRPVLYMDFDGVLNFFGGASSSTYRKRSGGLGYVARRSVYANRDYDGNWVPDQYGKHALPIKFSGELLRKLGALPADWLWLTTWKHHAAEFLDPMLGLEGTGWLDWEYDKASGYDHAKKLDALLADQAGNPRPFVWADDEATVGFESAMLSAPVPHLVLAPKEATGLTMTDLTSIQAFIALYAS